MRVAPGLAALLCAAACSEAPPPVQQQREQAAAPAPAKAAPATTAVAVKESSELLEFGYSYPAEAAAVPFIAQKLQKELKDSRADALKMAREDAASAKQAGYPFRPHGLEVKWAVKADTPRFLSLLSENYGYTGGAHGMTGYGVLLWDKVRVREIMPEQLMTSPKAFADAVGAGFCDALDKQRAEKRGEPVTRGEDDFSRCVDPLKQVLVPVSRDGKRIDRIMVVIGPYEAGPYAEGSYEVPLPVDAALLAAIKPEYQDAFAPAR